MLALQKGAWTLAEEVLHGPVEMCLVCVPGLMGDLGDRGLFTGIEAADHPVNLQIWPKTSG